jgi:SPW repeat
MGRVSYLKKHRTWEDWAGIGLGILIGLSPWIAGPGDDRRVLFITAALGLLVMMLAQFELVSLHRSLEAAELACGLALIALPFILGYASSGQLRIWHFVLGVLVAALALLELWQGWSQSDEEMAKHGP